MRVLLVVAVVAIGLAGCTRTAHLYPANDTTKGGVLDLNFTSYGSGHGEGEVAMPDGEIMKGEYSLVRGGSVGFGSVFASVYGPGGSASGAATSTSLIVPGGSPGSASLFGDKGTSMTCEFYNDNWSGHGYGACRSSKRELYRMQY